MSESPQTPRYLLIVTGDGMDLFSAPADCASVKRVKAEVTEAAKHRLNTMPEAGLGVLAMALHSRLTGGPCTIINGRERYGNVFINGRAEKPLIHENDDFNYDVDANKLITDVDLADWRLEKANCPGDHGQLFEVQIIDDCC